MLKINLFALFAGGEIANLVLQSGPVAKAVLVILLVFSLFSWAIILSKWSRFNRARRQSGRFIRSFRKAMRLADVAAAIPAVIFYNIFTNHLREFGSRMDDFALEMLNTLENANQSQAAARERS